MKQYVVFFKNHGYYAKYQPNYAWSFTQNLNEALIYKTEEKAKNRARHAVELDNIPYGNGIIIEIELMFKIIRQYNYKYYATL